MADEACLVNREVEITGRVEKPSYNGRMGLVYAYDAREGRCGVLLGGHLIKVKPDNLRLKEAAKEPFQFAVRPCDACGLVGVCASSPDVGAASRHYNKLVHPCGHCREAVYCSKACQKIDWPQHKPSCIIAKDAFDLIRAYTEDLALNAMLCERADEEVEDMPKRRLIHFQCSGAQTLKELRDKTKLMGGGVDVTVQYAPFAALDAAETTEEVA